MPQSTAYIIASGIDYTYRFCGVTEIEYNFALNIDADTSQGGDIINGARRLPNQIRLSVVETDVASQLGWAAFDPAEPGPVPGRDLDGQLGKHAAFGDHGYPGRGKPVWLGWGYCVYAVYPEERAVLH